MEDEFKAIDPYYMLICAIGSGSYGDVFKAKNIKSNEIVAIKYIKKHKCSQQAVLNEIENLTILNEKGCSNIIYLHNSINSLYGTFLIFDYCPFDLHAFLLFKFTIPVSTLKHLFRQMLEALKACHLNLILHRDIKPSNILLTSDYQIKLTDFGLSCKIGGELTNKVIVIQYRPPELLLGSKKYGFEVDIWSLGCIFFEMIDGKQLFPIDTSKSAEHSQLYQIFSVCGLPQDWSSWKEFPKACIFSSMKKPQSTLRSFLQNIPSFREQFSEMIPLLEGMLQLNPQKRFSAQDCLNHPFLINIDKEDIPQIKFPESHLKVVQNKIA